MMQSWQSVLSGSKNKEQKTQTKTNQIYHWKFDGLVSIAIATSTLLVFAQHLSIGVYICH